MAASSFVFSGPGQAINFGTVYGGVRTTVSTVVLSAEALRSAANTPADGAVHLLKPTDYFTGRQDELEAIREALSARRPHSGAAAVVVHGLGGVGKSALALQYAQTFRETYDLVWWIDASSQEKIEKGLSGITQRLRPVWPGTPQQPELASWAVAWLERHSRWLLVYDDVEDPALLSHLLGSLVGGHHLITSRLGDVWDHLGVADSALLPLGVLRQNEAADLLWSRVSEWNPGESRWETAQLARELDGLPVALVQVGAYLRHTRASVADYRRELGLRLFRAAARPDPQRTVARIWQVTLKAIAADDPSAVELLYALAWLDPNECPRDLITRLASDVIAADDALGVLHAYGMITFAVRDVRVHRLVQGVLRAAAITAARHAPHGEPAFGRPRGRHEAEQALLQAVYPRGVDEEHDASELARLAGQVCALAATDPEDCYCAPVSVLYARAALHLEGQEGHTVRTLPLYKAYKAQVQRAFGPDHPEVLAASSAVARVYEAAGRLDDAFTILEPALEQSLRVLGPANLTTLNLRRNLASAHKSAGRLKRAIVDYERAVATSLEAFGPNHLRTLTLQDDLAQAYESAGCIDEAIEILEDIVQRHAYPSGDEILVNSLKRNGLRLRNNLAGAYESTDRFPQAIALYKEVLADFEEVYGPDHPDTLSCLGNLGYAYESAGDLGRAQKRYKDVLRRREEVLGEEHPDTLLSRSNYANFCLTTGDIPTALDLSRTTLTQRTGVLGPEHPDTLVSRNLLAAVHMAAGEPEQAVTEFVATLNLRRKVLGETHPDTLRSRMNLAGCYFELGDAARAVPLLEAVLAEQERLLGPESRDAVLARNNLAAAVRATGDLERAHGLITTVLEQRTRILGPNHLDTLSSHASLARIYEARGELDRAVPLYESTLTRLTELAGADHPVTLVVAGLLTEASHKREQDYSQA